VEDAEGVAGKVFRKLTSCVAVTTRPSPSRERNLVLFVGAASRPVVVALAVAKLGGRRISGGVACSLR
jgi:hypothetical protein